MIPASEWTGRIIGTNTGNVYLHLVEQPTGTLTGTLRVNDDILGLTVHSVEGTFDGMIFEFRCKPLAAPANVESGDISATGVLNQRGDIEGQWESTIGSAGRFSLAPAYAVSSSNGDPDQLHIARHDFGPIAVNYRDVVEIAEHIQKDFSTPVVVTISGETEKSLYLSTFKSAQHNEDFANVIKIRAQSLERGGIQRVIQVEFGPTFNFILAQSIDEAWARGKKDMLRQSLKKFENSYFTIGKRLGVSINQVLLFLVLIYLPSLDTEIKRAILLGGLIAIAAGLAAIDNKLLRHASIQLRERKPSIIDRFGSSAVSWVAGIIGTIIAGLLLAVLQGWLRIPPFPNFLPT